jgi:CRP-like cAMP-binding protein
MRNYGDRSSYREGLISANNRRASGRSALGSGERVKTLKSVGLFAHTPDDVLVDVAALLEELDFPAGETILTRGDPGSSLYIVVSGRARVLDGDRTLDYLDPPDVFGEMAALDPMPRMATVKAVVDTRVFRLEREPLRGLMRTRPEISRGIFHVLCQRLRARSDNLANEFVYMQQLAKITDAAADEACLYEPVGLDEVAQRTDELGQLARVFQRMAREVHRRKHLLESEVNQLRIEIDEAKKASEITRITGSDYFRHLKDRAGRLRGRRLAGRDQSPSD